MCERMEFGYANGYTRALMRVREEIAGGLLKDMKLHKRRVTQKELLAIVDCMIQGREELRENPFAFVRCRKDGGYEIFDSERRKPI